MADERGKVEKHIPNVFKKFTSALIYWSKVEDISELENWVENNNKLLDEIWFSNWMEIISDPFRLF